MNPRRIITYTPAASVDLVLLWYIGHYVIYYTDIINKNLKWFNSTSISLSNSSCTFLSSKKWLSAWGVHLLLQIKTCFHSFRRWRNTNILNLHWKNNHWASLPVLWRRFKKKKAINSNISGSWIFPACSTFDDPVITGHLVWLACTKTKDVGILEPQRSSWRSSYALSHFERWASSAARYGILSMAMALIRKTTTVWDVLFRIPHTAVLFLYL